MLPSFRRKTATALALLCLAALCTGDFTRGVHLLTTRHVLCALHGELLEAEAGAGESAPITSGTVAFLPAGAAVDRHEHCSLAATPTRKSAVVAPALAIAVLTVPNAAVVHPIEMAWALPRVALDDAPKRGPPSPG